VDVDTVRDNCRPRMLFEISLRSFDGRLTTRCDKRILLSFRLRSLSGRLLESLFCEAGCFRELKTGIRLEVPRLLQDPDAGLPIRKDGRFSAGEPADRGWEIQSSDNESSQAFSMVDGIDSRFEQTVCEMHLVMASMRWCLCVCFHCIRGFWCFQGKVMNKIWHKILRWVGCIAMLSRRVCPV
jgi:hypothetical protein